MQNTAILIFGIIAGCFVPWKNLWKGVARLPKKAKDLIIQPMPNPLEMRDNTKVWFRLNSGEVWRKGEYIDASLNANYKIRDEVGYCYSISETFLRLRTNDDKPPKRY